MKRIQQILLRIRPLLLAVSLVACNSASDDFTVIRWDGGSRMEDASWTIDGKSCPPGLEGFQHVLFRLKGLNKAAFIRIKYPGVKWNETTKGYQEDDPFPFQEHAELRSEFNRIMLEKKLTLVEEEIETKK